MKTFLSAACLTISAVFVPGGLAQTPVPTPTTPAPVVANSPAPTTPLPPLNRVIYGQRLPTPEELRNVAAAQGLTLERIEQTGSQIIAVYRTPTGEVNVTSYQILPASGVAPGQAPATVVVPAEQSTTTVVYPVSREVIYYDPYYFYPWYSPVHIGVGFTYRGGGYHHGGYYRGGFHGGGHFGHR